MADHGRKKSFWFGPGYTETEQIPFFSCLSLPVDI